jgi:hypothetical protein
VNNFIAHFESHRKNLSYQLSSRYNLEMKLDIFADILLYAKIEKRGFKIIHLSKGNEVVYNSMNDIEMVGEIQKKLRGE